jgi:hypothetical protein
VYIGNVFKAKMPATATRDRHYCTCLGHLGQRTKNSKDRAAQGVSVAGVMMLTFANGNTA